MARSGQQLVWTLIWLLILIFISLWIASISAEIYVLVSIFTPFVSGLEPILELCMKGINFPMFCSQNMKTGESFSRDDLDNGPKYDTQTNEMTEPNPPDPQSLA
jgi:hypothetical protein